MLQLPPLNPFVLVKHVSMCFGRKYMY